MDEINSSFGNLSMSAAEWKPSSAYNNNINNNNSDLNPEAVKEFIPGRGWSSSAAAAAAGELNGGLCCVALRSSDAHSFKNRNARLIILCVSSPITLSLCALIDDFQICILRSPTGLHDA